MVTIFRPYAAGVFVQNCLPDVVASLALAVLQNKLLFTFRHAVATSQCTKWSTGDNATRRIVFHLCLPSPTDYYGLLESTGFSSSSSSSYEKDDCSVDEPNRLVFFRFLAVGSAAALHMPPGQKLPPRVFFGEVLSFGLVAQKTPSDDRAPCGTENDTSRSATTATAASDEDNCRAFLMKLRVPDALQEHSLRRIVNEDRAAVSLRDVVTQLQKMDELPLVRQGFYMSRGSGNGIRCWMVRYTPALWLMVRRDGIVVTSLTEQMAEKHLALLDGCAAG